MRSVLNCNVAIVGGGTAGLALATALRQIGVEDVVVLERDVEAGGVPRHCGHYPFGVRELGRVLKGPHYARTLVENAVAAGVDIRTGVSVTALHPNARLSLNTAEGNVDLQANRVALCTGVRESSRAQRFLSGTRPQGVVTTGALQAMVYLNGKRPFKRPVILGSELVSFSAIMTCRHGGMRAAAMIEEDARVTVRRVMRPYAAFKGVPLHTAARDLRIYGQQKVEAVSFVNRRGATQVIETDGVIISGQFRPEAALLYASHLQVDAGTGGPVIDQYGRATDPSYFVTGNLLRPVETSGWCWHEAVETAQRLARDLRDPIGDVPFVTLKSADPALRFVVPQRLSQVDVEGAMTQMQLRVNQPVSGHLAAVADGKTLMSKFIDSRPERRVLAPLVSMRLLGASKDVALKIFR